MKIKQWISILIGSVIAFAIGNILPITNLYSKYLVHSHDDETILVAIIVLVEWPILLVIGGLCGFVFYKKCLTRK